ncbi:DUF4376 domain-containing protein [uncultured Desulfuromusa sp.]|uniref:DUF4376 domain-containing protein n=1 Tax=uncultured Desulfuromusa sp. TaxID=219183 RepID=UPI002AA87E34|nr:DUF4376 domain-containing protein [uncultured Desulfuromusa sp.]
MSTLVVYEQSTDVVVHVRGGIKSPGQHQKIFERIDARYPDQQLAWFSLPINITHHQFVERYEISAGQAVAKVKTAAELIAEAKSRLAKKRWQVETGGYEYNGFPVHSDDRAQSKTTQIGLAITAGLRTSVRWKFADDVRRNLTAAEFTALGQAFSDHSDKCFDCEEACWPRIEAGEYDIETIWAEEWALI